LSHTDHPFPRLDAGFDLPISRFAATGRRKNNPSQRFVFETDDIRGTTQIAKPYAAAHKT
jgi:hypothetical protein